MQSVRVSEIMTSPAIVISPDTPVSVANSVMRENRIRHLPVVENDRLVGLVSFGDLREASTSASINADSYELNFMLTQLAVGQLMKRKIITVTPETPLVNAAELMLEHKIAGIPVVDAQNAVLGIVAGFDLLKLLVQKIRDAEASESAE
jgi:acetoin utilization protein AcuB